MIYQRRINPIDQLGTGVTALVLRPKVMRFVDHEHEPSFSKKLFNSYLQVDCFALCGGKTNRGSEFPKKAGLVGDAAKTDEAHLSLVSSTPGFNRARFADARFSFDHDHF